MNVLKSLIGSLVGAVLATVIHHFARPSASEPILWFPMDTGILTGLAGGGLGGKARGSGGRLASGVLSALVAGGAIFGGDVVTSLTAKPGDYGPITPEQLTAQPDTSPEVATADSSTTDDPPDAASDATASSDTNTEVPVEVVDPANVASDTQDLAGQLAERSGEAPGAQPGQMYAEQSGQPAEASLLDKLLPFIFPGLGILLAYQFARGFRDSSQQG
ncbi:MAG TPA: hypothetical protein DCF63_10575 [Planctomycetaceae bacterium]|nr:hypothetical protein [Planctomycetaceae bacterium]